jgi:flagellar biogenesis protein FliO
MFARVLFGLILVAAPSRAFAVGLTGATYDLGAEEASITLSATGAFSEPEVRTDRGYVRVWLRGMSGDVRLDPPTDGTAVRWIHIRPGFSDTTVVIVKLGDNREIPDSAVRVEWGEFTARIFLARSELPQPAQETQIAAPAQEAAAAPAPPPEREAAAPAPIRERETEPAPADEPAGAVAAVRAPASLGLPSDNSTIPLLILLTAVLGAVYVGIKFVMKRRKKNPLADIEIVASKRLGTRHQIVLVRALGEDHLLSINGTQTQCIASTPSIAPPADGPAMPGAEPPPERASAILRRLEDHVSKQRKLAADVVPPKPVERKQPAENRFGKELMRFAIENEEPKPIPIRPVRARRHSESVRGLVELRERLAAG